MTFLPWIKSYSVGIAKMDEQHQLLAGMINELYDAMKDGKGQEIINGILDRVVQYAVTHFSDEEALMETHHFPELASHREEHQEFSNQIRTFQSIIKMERSTLSMEVLIFLHNWLNHHINGTDKKYGTFLNNKGVF